MSLNIGKMGNYRTIDTDHIITRFPPEPSGWLHIGHLKAILLNQHYGADKMIIRFDDTNPAKSKAEYVQEILKDLKNIKVDLRNISYTSDYFDIILENAKKLITNSNAYVDTASAKTISKYRNIGIYTQCRSNSVEQNNILFEQMIKGAPYVLRLKIEPGDLRQKNKAMRDPAIYRVVTTPHWRTLDKYLVYPLYDFACSIVDSIEGVTHAFRSNEYRDKNELYTYIQKLCDLRIVNISDYGRFNISYTVMSKRKLQKIIDSDNCAINNWDHPVFPTIRGFINRGITTEALIMFVKAQGSSNNIVNIDIKKLYSINRKIIDKIATRYFTVDADYYSCKVNNEVIALIDTADAIKIFSGDKITLINLCNLIVESVDNEMRTLYVSINDNPNITHRDSKVKLNWIKSNNIIKCRISSYDNLLTVPQIPVNADVIDYFNKSFYREHVLLANSDISNIKPNEYVQFIRKAYYMCTNNDSNSGTIDFIELP
jgi:glutamyl-tRNA synthetase